MKLRLIIFSIVGLGYILMILSPSCKAQQVMNNKFKNYTVDLTSRGKIYRLHSDTIYTTKDYATDNPAYNPEQQMHISVSSQNKIKCKVLAALEESRLNELKNANEFLFLTLFLDSNAIVKEFEFTIPKSRSNSILSGNDFSNLAEQLSELVLNKPAAMSDFNYFKVVYPIKFSSLGTDF